jgi:membrane-bound lytic murein transglycosylase D
MKIFQKSAVFLGLTICLSFSANAQTIIIGGNQNAPQPDTTIIIDDTAPAVDTFIPTADVTEVRARMQEIQRKMTMPVLYNSTVHSFIDFFIWKKPSFTKAMLERKNFYFPVYEKYLAKYGMPDELKYLSMIESALNPKIVSRAKAVGLWQFMPATGREHGLQINEFVDERMSIEKSTDAACRYLRQLYNIFDDWELALAAYNTGPGNVRRAIRKSGHVTNYWQLHPYLPRDTRTYVPQWTAIIYMMHHADSYGIYPEYVEEYIPTQSVIIDGYFNLENFSNASGISLDDIQKLNPHILKDYLPAWTRGFDLKIPEDKYSYFASNQRAILDSAARQPNMPMLALSEQNPTNVQPIESGVIIIGGNNSEIVANNNSERSQPIIVEDKDPNDKPDEDVKRIRKVKKKTYVVKRGDVLNRIAEKFDVELYDLKVWNHLKSSAIRPGQRLAILLDGEEVTEVERSLKSEKIAKRNIEKSKPRFHTVHHGDTLWSIAQRYGGIPIERLKKMNGLRSNQVKAGQKLKLG